MWTRKTQIQQGVGCNEQESRLSRLPSTEQRRVARWFWLSFRQQLTYKAAETYSSSRPAYVRTQCAAQMLKAWREKLTPEAKLTRPSQTFIIGTEKARSIFSASYSGLLRRADSALTCDIPTFRLLHKLPNWRWVAVVESAAELRAITTHIESPNPSTLIVAIVSADDHEQCALRAAALNELGGVGVVVATGADDKAGRAVQVVQRVLQTWSHAATTNAHTDEAVVRRVWGEPSLTAAGDFIIPPLWDSEGKIRAVVDAAGLDYEEIIRESSWNKPPQESEEVDIPILRPEEEEERRKMAKEMQEKDFEEHDAWLKSLEDKLSDNVQGRRGAAAKAEAITPGPSVEAVRGAAATASNSDFFQKLLSVGKR